MQKILGIKIRCLRKIFRELRRFAHSVNEYSQVHENLLEPRTLCLGSSKPSSDALDGAGERFVPSVNISDLAYEHFHRYLFACRFANGAAVLDVASGEGYGAYLLSKNAIKVVGVEREPSVVAHATSTYRNANLQFTVGDIENLKFTPESFDLITSFETLEHIKDPRAAISGIAKLLRPNGLFIASTPERDVYNKSNGPNLHHLHEMSRDEFGEALAANFRNVRLLAQRVTYGSLIWPISDCSMSSMRFDSASNNLRNFVLDAPSRATYLICIASNTKLQSAHVTLLESETLHNPIASLYGGIQERDALIRKLKADLSQIENK